MKTKNSIKIKRSILLKLCLNLMKLPTIFLIIGLIHLQLLGKLYHVF